MQIRQTTCFVALGISFLGSSASAAASPVSSVPPKANEAVTKTVQNPWKPLRKALYGECLTRASLVSVCRKNHVNIFIPVSGTDVTSIIGWYTATVDDNSQDHESNAGGDFHYAENKFDLARLAANIDRPLSCHLPLHSL